MEAVYPGGAYLALASFSEEKTLRDATEEIARLRTEQERLMRLPEQEWGEVCAILMQILASAARQGFKVNETDAVAAMDRGKTYVDRLRARLTAEVPQRCAYCHGNDRDMPCAYPSEGKPGCLRDQRLKARFGPGALKTSARQEQAMQELADQAQALGMGYEHEPNCGCPVCVEAAE